MELAEARSKEYGLLKENIQEFDLTKEEANTLKVDTWIPGYSSNLDNSHITYKGPRGGTYRINFND